MDNKVILFTAPNVVQLCEKEKPEPGENEVLVRLMVSTISSGTERANLTGEVNVSISSFDTKARFPRSGGYSSSGIVEKIGKNVTDLNVGDRVALSWSTHRKYLCIDKKHVYEIDDDSISLNDAALWHIGTFPLAAIRKCHLEIGESAIVMGLGVLGMIAVKLLRAAGAAPIIAVDPIESKREFALKHGADYALNPFDDEFAEKVKLLTGGGAKVAIEVTGNGKALDSVLDCMAPMGRVALLGCTRHSDFTIDYYHKVHGPGISLIGAHTMARPKEESAFGLWTERDDVLTQMRLTSLGRLKLSDMVEEIHSPLECVSVYKRLAEEPSFPLVQFDWKDIV